MMALGTHIAWTAIALLIAADCWFLWDSLRPHRDTID